MKIKTKHIFLADDDEDDYYVFAEILREVDATISLTWFDSCDKIVQRLTAKDFYIMPDLILLDTNMPGNSGQACLSQLRSNGLLDDIPIIVYSTASSPSAKEVAYKFGATGYMVKPVSVEELRKTISAMLALIK